MPTENETGPNSEPKERKKQKPSEHTEAFKNKVKLRDLNIAKLSATGLSKPKIVNQMKTVGWDISESTVKYVLKRDDIKEIIDQERTRLMSLVPQAVKNYERWVNNAHGYRDKSDKEIAFKATTKVLESPGLLSGTPSTQINLMMNSGNTIVSPVIEGMLKLFMDSLKPEIVEAEFESVDN